MLFNSEHKIYRYDSEVDILKEFYGQRQTLYQSRKEYMLARLQKDYEILVNKANFIQGVINENLRINKVKRKVLVHNLSRFGLKPMS